MVTDKSRLDVPETIIKMNAWLKEKYRPQELMWWVKDVKRKILIEQFLETDGDTLPTDYKFYCFSGKILFVKAIYGREKTKQTIHYSPQWEKLDHKTVGKINDETAEVSQPPGLVEMIEIAEKLSKPFKFMRVDLYDVKGSIYFGELTCYPGNTRLKYHPSEFDTDLGSNWKI